MRMMPTLRRWAATVALALLLAAGCAALGVWQWNRHVDRSAAVAVVQSNYDAPPVPLAEVTDGSGLAADQVWRVVDVEGRYLTGATVLLRNRPVDGQAGFHVLEPFLVLGGALDGSVLVVDRGWVPTGMDGSDAASVPTPPTGTVALLARLRADERPSTRNAPDGQVQAISVGQVRAASDVPQWAATVTTIRAYAMAEAENGAAPVDLGPLARPDTGLGSHLSYAFQWWVFALGALVGCGVLIGRDVRDDRAPTADGGPAETRSQGHRRRRVTAEEEEDALLDAQTG